MSKPQVVHKLARYNANGSLECALCRVIIPDADAWQAHLTGAVHQQTIQKLLQRSQKSSHASPQSDKTPVSSEPVQSIESKSAADLTPVAIPHPTASVPPPYSGSVFDYGSSDDDDDDSDDDNDGIGSTNSGHNQRNQESTGQIPNTNSSAESSSSQKQESGASAAPMVVMERIQIIDDDDTLWEIDPTSNDITLITPHGDDGALLQDKNSATASGQQDDIIVQAMRLEKEQNDLELTLKRLKTHRLDDEYGSQSRTQVKRQRIQPPHGGPTHDSTMTRRPPEDDSSTDHTSDEDGDLDLTQVTGWT